MTVLTREKAKENGYTHIAYHKSDSPKSYFKKGDSMLVKFNPKTGAYEHGVTQLLGVQKNWDIKEI